jgi:hypothetical protein
MFLLFKRRMRDGILLLAFVAITAVLAAPNSTAQSGKSSSRSSSSSSSAHLARCDRDRDGSRSAEPACGGQDCNDSDPEIAPGRIESSASACQDSKDNDCNGHTDCSDPTCAGKPAFIPGRLALKPSGICCVTETGGQAVDTSNDLKNCGGCGVACESHEMCMGGRCVSGCDLARTTCYREPVSFEIPVQRGQNGRYPSQIQALLDGISGTPACSGFAGKEPTFDVKYFSEPLLDNRGKPTGQSIRGVCVTVNF